SFEQVRAPLRVWLPSPKTAHDAFSKDIVAGEHFVGTFARENDLDATVAHELRQQKQRRRCGAHDRSFYDGHHVSESPRNVFPTDYQLAMIRPEMLGHLALKRRFVELVVLEAQRERAEAFAFCP